MKVNSLFRFAHISDLHFSRLFFGLGQFLSKRWIGNFNLMVNRKKQFDHNALYALIPLFQELKVDAVLLTGDLTTTAHDEEFALAKKYVDALLNAGLKVFAVPGNHDHYTRTAYRNLDFYRYFQHLHHSDDPHSFFKLKDDKISATHLGKEWWIVSVDSARSTSLFSSHGVFSEEIQSKLEHALTFLPPDQKVLMLNHFPFFETDDKKTLERGDALCALLKRFPQVKLYLHGHTHRHIVADLRPSSLPIVLDSGSTAQKKYGTWNLIDITEDGCDVSAYRKTGSDPSNPWEIQAVSSFMWGGHERTLV